MTRRTGVVLAVALPTDAHSSRIPGLFEGGPIEVAAADANAVLQVLAEGLQAALVAG